MSRDSIDYAYDVCVSFADENRAYVEAVVDVLERAGVSVFYDRLEQVELWGKDLYVYLDDVYRNKARFCVMFISERYAAKRWTTHERRSAQARAFGSTNEYLLPARFDPTEVPGLPDTVGYVSLEALEPGAFADLVLKKVGRRHREFFVPSQVDRLSEALGLETDEARSLAQMHVSFLMDSFRTMSATERKLVASILVSGCPSELPDNLHVSIDLLRRVTGLSPTRIKKIAGGLGSLGYTAKVRQQEHEDSTELGHDEYLVFQYASLKQLKDDQWIYNLGLETDTAFAAEVVGVLTGDYCAEHAIEALQAGDFSQLSVSTARDHHHTSTSVE